MTAESIAAAAGLVAATALLAVVVRRLGRETGLGLVHPASAWAVLTAIFFGVGSLVLAAQGRPLPAMYVAGAIVAVALGISLSGSLARRRERPGIPAGVQTPAQTPAQTPPHAGAADRGWQLEDVRVAVVVGIAVLGLLAITPTLLRTGLPFLVPDITGARVELAGLAVQLPRVALPALASVALMMAIRRPSPGARALAAAVIASIAVFEILLASRYLVAELVAVLILTWCFAGRRIPLAVVAVGLIGGISAFAGMQVARTWDQAASEPVAFAIARTVDRVILIGPRTLDALMTVIPAEQDHFGGLTWVRRLAPLVGRDDVPNLGYWIFPRVIPGGDGYAAPGWLGEAWANLGWAGLTLFGLLGVAMERLGALIQVRRGQATDIVAAALLVLFVARTHALGLIGLGVLAVFVMVWRLAAGPGDGLLRDLAAIIRWRASHPPARRRVSDGRAEG